MPYSVYKVDLDKAVWKDYKFRKENTHTTPFKSDAFYVGTTGKPIDERFNNHKTGVKFNKYVKEHGRSISAISEHKTWAEAHEKEIAVALEMKKKGVGVYQR